MCELEENKIWLMIRKRIKISNLKTTTDCINIPYAEILYIWQGQLMIIKISQKKKRKMKKDLAGSGLSALKSDLTKPAISDIFK